MGRPKSEHGWHPSRRRPHASTFFITHLVAAYFGLKPLGPKELFFQMPDRSLQQVKRPFARVFLTIAALDSVRLMVARDLPDEGRAKAFKRVSLKARPNEGGLLAHSQTLRATKGT